MTDRKPSAEAMIAATPFFQLEKNRLQLALALDDFADRHAHARGLVHDEPLADSVTGGQGEDAIRAAERRGEERMRERAAQIAVTEMDKAVDREYDDLVQAMSDVEDAIRSLPLTPDPEAGQ